MILVIDFKGEKMRPLCEYMISEFLPSFRAMVAKKLIEDHGFSQTQVAEMLNTTQPAISQYIRELRGKKNTMLKNPKIMEMIDKVVKAIAIGDVKPENTGLEFCKFCKFIREINFISGQALC